MHQTSKTQHKAKRTKSSQNLGVCADQANINLGAYSKKHTNSAPIGVFDSGFGGLTVAREIAKALPCENLIYLGDSLRCPYGPREPSQVRDLVRRICTWLASRDVKMIVIACNTATAAGLELARREFDVPVLGVISPGARAATAATQNKKVGVIATKGTVNSGAYSSAIRALDPNITVFSTPTPRFVEIAEAGVKMAQGPIESYTSLASKVYIRPEFQEIAREYLEPLRRCNIDTLVMGCTHFPLLKSLIGSAIGRDVKLINSAREVARDVVRALEDGGLANGASGDAAGEMLKVARGEATNDVASNALDNACNNAPSNALDNACNNAPSNALNDAPSADVSPRYEFFTTGNDLEEFKRFGERVFRSQITNVSHIEI